MNGSVDSSRTLYTKIISQCEMTTVTLYLLLHRLSQDNFNLKLLNGQSSRKSKRLFHFSKINTIAPFGAFYFVTKPKSASRNGDMPQLWKKRKWKKYRGAQNNVRMKGLKEIERRHVRSHTDTRES